MDRLPALIRTSVDEHLRDRVGAELQSRLRFVGGQVIDPARLRASAPAAAAAYKEIPTYVLLFSLKGISRSDYLGCMELNEAGGIVAEVSLPAAAIHPEKAPIMTRSVALKTAKANGVPVGRATTSLAYFADVDALEWLISYAEDPKAMGGQGRTCHVPADGTGSVHWSSYTLAY